MPLALGRRFLLITLLAAPLSLAAQQEPQADSPAPSPEGVEYFEQQIRPVLVERCYSCHSASAAKLKGGLRLDTREGLRKGGDTGPSIDPRDPARSLLLRAIRRDADVEKMPPKDSDQLSAAQIRAFQTWVTMGAPDPRAAASAPAKPRIDVAEARRRWPFCPVAEPALPAVRDTVWARTPVDGFILAKLEEKGIRPAPDADPRTLIRRVTYDLTGLPPTPEEIDAFLSDASSDAFRRVVDRLLASPAYGERWGRHWLDVARYSDAAGDNSDYPIPQMYKYRNYVLAAFNEDKPYDRFIREQIAGDLLPARDADERKTNLIATGYLANARRFGSVTDDYPWHLTIEDTIDNLGRTFLGVTASCSRCHDHKFDPITNEDYYALYGIFESTRYPFPGIELQHFQSDLVYLAPEEQVQTAMRERRETMTALDAAAKVLGSQKTRVDAAGKDGDDESLRAKKAAEDLGKEIDALQKERTRVQQTPLPYESLYAVTDAPIRANAHVQIKGDPARLGREVPRRFFEVLGAQALSPDESGSGRRELADWIADPSNPLTARVMANRVWHWHFGKGIVQTPSDFGRQGRAPTHPELLDWLACRFVESGWSIKALHRLILSSHAYRVSCDDDPAALVADPANDLMWKFRRRRLEAEAIRDSILAVAGTLDRGIGGPHPIPPMPTWEYTEHKPFLAVYDHHLRSVYLLTQRISRHPFLGIFDGAETNSGTPARITSTTSLQALSLLNDPFLHQQAAALAGRLAKEGPDDRSRIDRAFLLALGRRPSEAERASSLEYLDAVRGRLDPPKAWESFARILFRLSEFVYVR
ncbi:MAG TPA: PSD1 and planctomycete cytochrome C domain-containing protein [Planctomycetota bacterium]|nr:PSD1 and planctomycete cytochrome C domain-containing protein [Planctomycetota bacterium]